MEIGEEEKRVCYAMQEIFGARSSVYSEQPQVYMASKLLVHPIHNIALRYPGFEHSYRMWEKWYEHLVNSYKRVTEDNLNKGESIGSHQEHEGTLDISKICDLDVRLFDKILDSPGPGTISLEMKRATVLRPVISTKSYLCNSVPAVRAAMMQEEREKEIRKKHREDMERERDLIRKEDADGHAKREKDKKILADEIMKRRKIYSNRIGEIISMAKEDSLSKEWREITKVGNQENVLRQKVGNILKSYQKDHIIKK